MKKVARALFVVVGSFVIFVFLGVFIFGNLSITLVVWAIVAIIGVYQIAKS